MDVLSMEAIRAVVAAINDDRNPQAQFDALTLRDQWLLEAGAGTLRIPHEGRPLFENA